MKKPKVILVSIGIISLFLLIPLAQATNSKVWFNTSTELVWKITEEILDESLEVTSTEVMYLKHNFTEITPNPDNLTVAGPLFTATDEDVTTYGFDNATIWGNGGLSINVDILDNDLTTHFVSLFNEQNTNITEIATLSTNDQTFIMCFMGILLDSAFGSTVFLYMAGQLYGSTYGHNSNSSTIISNTSRTIVYDLFIDFSVDQSGHWSNKTYNGNVNLTYGETSNVLLHSEISSHLIETEWNGSAYVSETIRTHSMINIIAPESLLDDFPEPESEPEPEPKPKIPGYSVTIVLGTIALTTIPVFIAAKRKKK